MITKLGRPYAEAFLQSLGSTGAAQDALAQLRSVVEASEQAPGLSAMAANPAIPLAVKKQALHEIGDSLNLGQSVRRLLELLLENYRFGHLAEVLAAFEELLNRRVGVVKASVTTAHELDDEQRDSLASTLGRIAGAKVEFDLDTDASLLGGFVATIGSRRYDASVKGELDRMARAMGGEATA